ncbi:MAG: hypothetical protein M1816_005079 [Peltula sp. TS41687]|nr:MAG: hypothetical protein M1816_005079 [Peltula sp. TS41687]
MKLSAFLTGILPLVTYTYSIFDEQLDAQGLLGSHFGVPGLSQSFDYVIVGGGTAGLALARRLAANSSFAVAVVEAGDFYEFANGNLSEIPAYTNAFLAPNPKNPRLDWYQYTERQAGLVDRTLFYPSGKVLGGNSARNSMWSSRGAYKKWASLVGDSEYEFDHFLPYFKKSAQFHPPNEVIRRTNSTSQYNATAFSASGGPLQVGYPNWVNPISSWIGLGLSELGLQELSGLSDGNISGWGYTAFTIDPRTQTRSSSETSYLREALIETRNLQVYKDTMAKRILFDGNKRAVGVSVDTGGAAYQLNATKEVIISGGAFRSPQLLMVSGIGPRAVLEDLNIPVISDLAGVGQGMWDHISFRPAYAVNLITHNSLSVPSFAAQQTADYVTNRTGLLTNPGGDVLGFAMLPSGSISNSTRADLDSFSSDWPEYEHLFLDRYVLPANNSNNIPSNSGNYVTSLVALTLPFSRGNVTILSNDTAVHPVVNPNWLTDPRDQEMALAAVKQARAVFTGNATSPIIIGSEVFPGLSVSTDTQILDFIQQSASTTYHASCTCAMGMVNDSMAVLDSKARVYGVQGLRVVDASAFPVLPPGHPMATVYALAEKIADAILKGT